MELTFAKTKTDLEEIADLMAKTFVRRSYFDFYQQRMRYQTEDPWFKPEHSRLIRENGKIVSHVSIIEKPVRFGPAVVKLAGIGDVCTHPNARGKGYAQILMEDALHYMKEHGYPLTMLYGIPNFYHKFGYIESVKDYKLLLDTNKALKVTGSYRVRPWREGDLPAMLKLYQDNFQDQILTVVRTTAYLRRLLTEPKRIILAVDDTDQPVGYAHVWDDITRQYVVNEAAAANLAAAQTLLHAILAQAPQPLAPALEIRMSPRWPFVRQLQHLGSETKIRAYGEGEGNGMLAIINLQQLLAKIKPLLNQRLQQSEFLNLSKPLTLATEQESVTLSFKQGEVIKVEASRPQSRVGLLVQANHRYLVRNLVGYWSIDELLTLTNARVSDDHCRCLLAVLLPETEPFMLPLDYF